ncbi:alanine racemase [Bombilactobacillus bombi]|uniref:alanine racemase n=1 Tax=Bombilactobacillus bombi TaxID=1303590 RepID=UPI0015E5FE31|nr:alanine racemase [Bombilactobacillus bombi]MBA1434264.1 alanine racemase [Bombilactobacillus bombi]
MKPAIHRPTEIIIDRQALKNNLLQERQLLNSQTSIFAVVKANAYGHGALEVAQTLSQVGVDGFCVAVLDEALELRAAGLTQPILVLGVTPVAQANLAAQNNISLTVATLSWLQEAAATLSQPLKVHLALDTGMGRIGFTDKASVICACDFISQQVFLIPEGIFTHFATADEVDSDYFEQQVQIFKELTADLPIQFKYVHCANSATSLWHLDCQSNMIRLGISLYGLNPSGTAIKPPYDLQPALSLKSQIVHIKKVAAGQKIGYGATYTAPSEEIIATVPIGYADGWLRRMSGSYVLVQGHFCPIVGRVCMDQLMIKVPKLYPLGTTVTLIGVDHQAHLSVEAAAKYAQTINYEIICNLSDRIVRKYVN